MIDILHNDFKPENVGKIHTSFRPIGGRSERPGAQSSTNSAEQDRRPSDYSDILSLLQPFEVYCQILVHFAAPIFR